MVLRKIFIIWRATVMALAWLSASAVMFMMLVTASDVVLRLVARPITGAYDMVRIACAVAVAGAIPYTTAVKGHVAVEFFFHKLSHRWRARVDFIIRILGISLFLALARQSLRHGGSLRVSGQVTPTLQWPMFWVMYVISFCCVVTAGVIFYHLLHPGKEMIKP